MRLVEHLHAVVLLQHRWPRRASSGSPCPRSARPPAPPGSGGSAPGPSRCTSCTRPRSWRRWCAACRAPAPASAGWRRRRCPAAPPAPISVCASSMNRMIGLGEACTSSITCRRRSRTRPSCSRRPAAGRCRARSSDTSFSGGGTSPRGDPQREALDHRGLADAGLAGEDRVVLPAAHQDVDDLADLLVAADDRVDLALARRARSGRPRTASAPPACPSRPAPSRRSPRRAPPAAEPSAGAQRVLGRAADDLRELVGQRVGLDRARTAARSPAARCAAMAS